MAFNITGFQGQIRSGVRPNLFKVIFDIPPALTSGTANAATTGPALSEKLSFLCKSAALPSSTMGTIEVPFRGRNLKIPGDRTFDSWTATFINDPDFTCRTTFERWINLVNQLGSNVGQLDPSQIFSTITVQQLNKAGTSTTTTTTQTGTTQSSSTENLSVIRTYKLVGSWPSSVSQITLGYDQNDQIEEFDVEFQYQYFEIGGGQQGTSLT